MEQELKPCPFCGGPAELEQTGKNDLTVRCRRCLMGLKQRALLYDIEWLRGKMIDSWNQRVNPLP